MTTPQPPELDPFVKRTLDLAAEHLEAYDGYLATCERDGRVGSNLITEMRTSVRGTLHRISRLLGGRGLPPVTRSG